MSSRTSHTCLQTRRIPDGIRISQETRRIFKAIFLLLGALQFFVASSLVRLRLSYAGEFRLFEVPFLVALVLFGFLLTLLILAVVLYVATMRCTVEIGTAQVKIYGRWTGTKVFYNRDIISVTAMRDVVFEHDPLWPGVYIHHRGGREVVFRYIPEYAGRCYVANLLRSALDGDYRTQKERDALESRVDDSDPLARLLQQAQ